MKFYSEKTGLLYETEKELNAAELKIAKEEAEKKAKKEEESKKIARDLADVINSIKEATTANDKAENAIDSFYNKYKNNKAAYNALKLALKDTDKYNFTFTNPSPYILNLLDLF